MSTALVQMLIAVLVLTGLIFLSILGILNPVLDWGRVVFDFLSYPLVGILNRVNDVFTLFFKLRNLAVENIILGQQVEKLSSELAALERARQENRVLREALSFQGESGLSLIPAEIIGWDSMRTGEKITLNRGRRHAVSEGQAVLSTGGVLVGVVTGVFENTSQMELITSSNVAVNAEAGQGPASGIVRGEHGVGLLFDLISQNDIVKPGDRVVTSGLGGSFPKNLLIGEVGKILTTESELFQKASIIPSVDFRKLRMVFVIKP
ncbi:MAG: rod shape-determining protein MreC [Candidatus Doudnabacteria bacterium]|nr:rod shape-determining protein MreC [Candidatus Doudnabacteria bacterium]